MSDTSATAAIPAGFRGAAARLNAADIDRAAAKLGLEPRLIQAVASVEAANRGFLPDGRPELLFEAHQFHQLTAGRWDAAHPNISSPTWDQSLYGAAGAHQYERLAEAMQLDREAALQSATWGMFQVLGTNHVVVGYPDIDAFVAAMCDSEGRHIDAFAAFCAAENLARYLQAHDWVNFALGYNGPGELRNTYAARLMLAYEKGSFPPLPPPPPAPQPPPMTDALEIPVGERCSFPITAALDKFGSAVVMIPPDLLRSDDIAVCSAVIDGKTIHADGLAIGQTMLRGADRVIPISVGPQAVAHLDFDLSKRTYSPLKRAAAAGMLAIGILTAPLVANHGGSDAPLVDPRETMRPATEIVLPSMELAVAPVDPVIAHEAAQHIIEFLSELAVAPVDPVIARSTFCLDHELRPHPVGECR